YQDGSPLRGQATVADVANPGSKPFPAPFVFPSGVSCRNFDQLALACADNWAAAVDLLRRGFLASFLGHLGRADLAAAAPEAARFPDPERGLEQLLTRLPARSLPRPVLVAEPAQLNLGTLRPGTDFRLELRLSNRGKGLLYGSVSCEGCDWLALGEGQGAPHKLFQFLQEASVAVHVRGQQLRASPKALEGRLVIQSNGGTQ